MRIKLPIPITLRHETTISGQRSALLVTLVDGSIVATASVNALESDDAWISSVHVSPGHRRAGHGRRLITAAIDIAKQAKRTRVALWVNPKNRAALAMYCSLGFDVVQAPKTSDWMMVKQLHRKAVSNGRA